MNIPDFIPVLGRGNHAGPKTGACVMEMVSFIAGEQWTDNPQCVHNRIASVARQVNDFVSDDNRQVIAHMIPRFIGTDKIDEKVTAIQWDEQITEAMREVFGKYDFINPHMHYYPHYVLTDIKDEFMSQKDIDKRLTNEEYDALAMKILEVTLDVADQVLERGKYAIEIEEAFAKIAELPCQKVHS
jgi:hypothetical protein